MPRGSGIRIVYQLIYHLLPIVTKALEKIFLRDVRHTFITGLSYMDQWIYKALYDLNHLNILFQLDDKEFDLPSIDTVPTLESILNEVRLAPACKLCICMKYAQVRHSQNGIHGLILFHSGLLSPKSYTCTISDVTYYFFALHTCILFKDQINCWFRYIGMKVRFFWYRKMIEYNNILTLNDGIKK